jgi:hypothetical protein
MAQYLLIVHPEKRAKVVEVEVNQNRGSPHDPAGLVATDAMPWVVDGAVGQDPFTVLRILNLVDFAGKDMIAHRADTWDTGGAANALNSTALRVLCFHQQHPDPGTMVLTFAGALANL